MVQVDFATLYGLLHNRKSPIFMYDDGTVSLHLDLSKNLIGCWTDVIWAEPENLDICLRLEERIKEKVFPLYIDSSWCTSQQMPAGNIIGKIWAPLSEQPQNAVPETQIGWYAFAEGKFSPNPKDYPKCQGVVAWINPEENAPKGERGLILMPEESDRIWVTEYGKTEVDSDEDGYGNTKRLLEYGKKNDVRFLAAEWCAEYCRNGIKSGEAFMPAVKQLQKMLRNLETINRSLAEIDGVQLHGWIWSSTDGNCYYAWGMATQMKSLSYNTKHYHALVRCVLAF